MHFGLVVVRPRPILQHKRILREPSRVVHGRFPGVFPALVRTRRLPRWALAGLIAASVAALTSGWRPWLDALGGAVVPADIPQDFAAVHLVVNGVNPYGPEIRQMQ